MSRRAERARRLADEARGVDTRTGEIREYPCPPELLWPFDVYDWTTPRERDTWDAYTVAVKTWRRALDARRQWVSEREDSYRLNPTPLVGPCGRPPLHWAE